MLSLANDFLVIGYEEASAAPLRYPQYNLPVPPARPLAELLAPDGGGRHGAMPHRSGAIAR
jgi:hypothetical protein